MNCASGWIWEDNLGPLLEVLAHYSRTELVEGEVEAIDLEIAKSDGEAEPIVWGRWQFTGPQPIEVRFAKDHGTSVLHVEFDSPEALAREFQAILGLMNSYRLRR
ncbi:MAG: hypothetical protein ACYS26_11195 [Planctomycetota bacterium]|jgi:hypothetical protein